MVVRLSSDNRVIYLFLAWVTHWSILLETGGFREVYGTTRRFLARAACLRAFSS